MTEPSVATLTEAQLAAVSRRGESLALSATAGSGKTRVLVERFVRAVLEDSVAPERILAITFTDKAAHELRLRVRGRFIELGERQAASDADAAFISTIHGFCTRLLRSHPLAAGLDPDFAVLDEASAVQLRHRAFDRALARFLDGKAGIDGERALTLAAEFGIRRLELAVRDVHERLRSSGMLAPQLPATPAATDRRVTDVVCALDGLLGAYGAAYADLKRGQGAVDFDDLELEALALLRTDRDRRSSWAERFTLMMVDEYQDTNPRQAELLELLERGNLFVVGDEFQSIYGFRHAEPALFRARRDALAPSGAAGELTENFRSHPEIVAAVNAAFAPRFGERFRPLVAARGASPTVEPAVELLLTDCAGRSSVSWRRDEARLLAERLAALLAAGVTTADEVLVLLRAGTDMATYDRALAEHGVRTLPAGGGYWSALEVLDLLAYLRALANPLDTAALYGVLGSPLVGASTDALALVGMTARELGRDPWWTLRGALVDLDPTLTERLADLPDDDRDRLTAFANGFARERALRGGLRLDALVSRPVEATGYLDGLRCLPDGERRVANVHKLLRIARAFEAREGRDLRRFLEHVEASSVAVPREPEAPPSGEDSGAVRLMTIHGAKGLEADVVCVADLGRTRGNGEKPYLLCDDGRLGVCVPEPDGSFTEALDYAALRERLRAAESAEEDRILYVAMTRARKRLVLSGAVELSRWPAETRTAPPISWLGPGLVPDIDARLLEAPVSEVVRPTDGGPLRVGLVRNSGSDGARPTARQMRMPTRRWASPGRVAPMRFSPRALSYSSLSAYSRCGYRYYLERVLGLAATPTVEDATVLSSRDRGTLVHGILERLDFARPGAPTAEEVLAEARVHGFTPSADDVEEVRELIDGFVASELCVRIAAARHLRREQPFAFELGGTLINGFFDLLADEPTQALVVDYKSDRVGDDDIAALTDLAYGAQRRIYGLAALRSGVAAVEVVHCYLERPDEPVAVRFDATLAAEAEHDVRALAGEIAGGRFDVAADPHRELCASCPGRARLCSWDEEMTMRSAQDVVR